MPQIRTQAHVVLTALVEELAARPQLEGVSVTSGPIGYDQREKLEFWRIEATEQWATWGQTAGRPTKNDEFELIGAVWASSDGSGEETIVAARERAYEILGELSDYLRDTPKLGNALVLWGQLSAGDLDQGFADQTRYAQLEFRVKVKARI